MLKIYGSDLSSPSNKVRFTANFLKLKYEYVRVNLREGEQRKEEFLRKNPVGKIPVLEDDGFFLFESGAIVKYLARKEKSGLYPSGIKERAIVEQWIDFGTLHVSAALSRLLYNRVFAKIRNEEVDERSIKDGLKFLAQFLPVVDEQLKKALYLCGKEITLADINLLAGLDPAEVSQLDLGPYQNIVRWRNGLKKQDFYTQCYKEYGEALIQKTGK